MRWHSATRAAERKNLKVAMDDKRLKEAMGLSDAGDDEGALRLFEEVRKEELEPEIEEIDRFVRRILVEEGVSARGLEDFT